MILTCQAFTQSIQHNRTTPARQLCVTHAHHDSRAGAPQRYIAVSTLTSARVAPPLLPAAFPATPACLPPLPALLPGSQHTPHRTARSRHTSPRCPLLPSVPMSPAAASPPQLPAAESRIKNSIIMSSPYTERLQQKVVEPSQIPVTPTWGP